MSARATVDWLYFVLIEGGSQKQIDDFDSHLEPQILSIKDSVDQRMAAIKRMGGGVQG